MTTENAPFQRSVALTAPYRSRVVSVHSTSYDLSLVGKTEVTSTDTVSVCARFEGGSALEIADEGLRCCSIRDLGIDPVDGPSLRHTVRGYKS